MRFYRFALHKRYFDQGMGILNYPKYVFLMLGFASRSLDFIIFLSLLWGVSAYMIGWWWCNSGMLDAENEVLNQFNPFQKEVRKKLIRRKS